MDVFLKEVKGIQYVPDELFVFWNTGNMAVSVVRLHCRL